MVVEAPDAIGYVPGVTPHPRTRRRWNQRLQNEGHCRQLERRGNKCPNGIVGSDKLGLSCWKDATDIVERPTLVPE